MKKSFNAYLLYLAIAILTIGTNNSLNASPKGEIEKCPNLKTAEEVVEFFIQADSVGARLTSNTKAKLKSCISFDDVNAWDAFQVISSYEINECPEKKKQDKKCFEIKYGQYGKLFSSKPFSKNKEVEFVVQRVEVVKNGSAWSLNGTGDIFPMLSKNGAVDYLQEFQGKENTKEQNNWLKAAALDIESLK